MESKVFLDYMIFLLCLFVDVQNAIVTESWKISAGELH